MKRLQFSYLAICLALFNARSAFSQVDRTSHVGEFEYLRRINNRMEFQWSLIPGAPLIITSLFGVRFLL